jgi:hypothetical protein
MVNYVEEADPGWTTVVSKKKVRRGVDIVNTNTIASSEANESVAIRKSPPRTGSTIAAISESDWLSEPDGNDHSDRLIIQEPCYEISASVDDETLSATSDEDLLSEESSFVVSECVDGKAISVSFDADLLNGDSNPNCESYICDEREDMEFRQACAESEVSWETRYGKKDYESITDYSEVEVLSEMTGMQHGPEPTMT